MPDKTHTTHCSLISRLIALAVALIFLACNVATAEIPSSAKAAQILQVIDGDTVIVLLNNRREHVRLIGIDTPESRQNPRAQRQAQDRHVDPETILELGHRASEFTRGLLPKKSTVFLEFDLEQRDRYQRLLAYAWVRRTGSRTEMMANEEIIKAGYAYLLTVPPNVKYRQRFASAFNEARRNKRGLWSR